MAAKPRRISKHWIQNTREYFKEFLDETDFPDPERFGERGPKYRYPERILFDITFPLLAPAMLSG